MNNLPERKDERVEQPDDAEETDLRKNYKMTLREASRIASERFGLSSYNTFHLLLAIMRRDVFLREWLENKGVSVNTLLANAEQAGKAEAVSALISLAAKMAITAGTSDHPAHLLYAILSSEGCYANTLLRQFCNPGDLSKEILDKCWHQNPPGRELKEKGRKGVLEDIGIDYTEMAREGKLKPVIGRDRYMMEMVEILARKDLGATHDEAINNPLITGKAGVGKSAIAKGLATLIARKDERVRVLWDHRLIYLSLSDLQVGTGVRGSLESRVKALLKECEQEPIILFVDELHMIMGLGRTEGSSGLQEILKPALAGGLNCIGATTTEEWRREIESKDPAFAQRWITVPLEEPDKGETLRILTGLVDSSARRHIVHFPMEVLSAAVEMGRKYIPDIGSPRREIDHILDGVGAKVKLAGRISATVDDVTAVVGQITGSPVQILTDERSRLVDAEAILNRRVVGQQNVIKKVAQGIQRHRSGVADPEKPLVYILLGPSGVGKTWLATVTVEEFLLNHLIRIDMSQFGQPHMFSRLISSPHGYVGHDEPGELTAPLSQFYGMAGIIFDEVEKAHFDVIQGLLGLLDKGIITDGKGRNISAKNSIIFFTSNVGSECYYQGSSRNIGFTGNQENIGPSPEEIKEQIMIRVRDTFSPEFLNRVDEILIFNPLTRENIFDIARLMLEEEKERCLHSRKPFDLEWEEAVVEFLAIRGYSYEFGARPMKREIARHVQNLLADLVLKEIVGPGAKVHLYVEANMVKWRIA